MAKDEASNEVGSDACSNSSNYENEDSDTSQSCSEGSSEVDSSSDQNPSSSASSKEARLAEEVCLKRKQPRDSSCSGSSEEQSSSCSESSSCESSKCCLESECCAAANSVSSSEDTESHATESSTDVTPSEESSKTEKVEESNKKNKNHPKSREGAIAKEDKSGWSLSEDALLRSMKEANDGLSWEDIGNSLSRGKNECKSRWKAIKNLLSPDALSENGAKRNAEPATQPPTEAQAVPAVNSDTKAAAPTEEQEAADRGSTPEEDLTESDRQQQYWYEHIGRPLYPASLRVEPDAHFSPSDCRVLEMADARYRSTRWLETQARFYNETGRMVPLEVIRRKCEDAAVRTEADIDGWLKSISNK
ncbi:hypothetical protein CCM_03922 [Cordyceps militaris CM01]|uniref:Myb-like domain-containing protein n=2 Tax=Cordyceps militaris TaxID=73501 RepID=G3JD74_CORMM|nr:uncharacterized protein CCM_03922 [Cordyceps militaris CM01]ATY66802.1 hypothetical protein A9K55_000898 [Cordyceps militaris]EGX92549.1 hypothetical protein CCM_03922 [Cordyceps militaris CM01]